MSTTPIRANPRHGTVRWTFPLTVPFGAIHTQLVLHGYPDPAGGWSVQGGLGIGTAQPLVQVQPSSSERQEDVVGGWGPEGHIGAGYAWEAANDWDPSLLLRFDVGTYHTSTDHTNGVRLTKYGLTLVFRFMMH